MDIPITQSKAWQNLQSDLKEPCFFEETTNYQYLAIKKNTPVGNYLYLPYGPVLKEPKALPLALKSLHLLASQEKAIFIRIEPQNATITKFFPKNTVKTKDLNPKETWILDLSGTDEDLKAKLPSRLLRYYKNQAKNGLSIKTSHNPEDIKYLLSLQKALAAKKGINTFSEDYLKTELKQPFATLYLLNYQNPETHTSKVIAAGLVFDDETTRYNLQGAQSEEGRKLHATGILTIQLILDAKIKNLKTFDFWGVAPENAPKNHPWRGFTEFKKTFAGTEKKYAGTYDVVINPLKYKIYQLSRSINKVFRRIF